MAARRRISSVMVRPPARSPCRPEAEEDGVSGWAPSPWPLCRARWRRGGPARRRAAGRRHGSRGQRWPGGCGGRRSPGAGCVRTARLHGRGPPARRRGGDGEQGDVGRRVVQDQADRLGLRVPAGQRKDPGTVVVGPGLLRMDPAVPDPVVELGELHVRAVDLVGVLGLPRRSGRSGAVCSSSERFGVNRICIRV
jgi:hypothetical protein